MWLDCYSERQIAEDIGVHHDTINQWLSDFRTSAGFRQPPGQTTTDPGKPGYWGNVQHVDVWSFSQADKDAAWPGGPG